jgi:hypothetical protein
MSATLIGPSVRPDAVADPGDGIAATGPVLPHPRGPLSAWLTTTLLAGPARAPRLSASRLWSTVSPAIEDAATDEDVQLALHIIYELSYRGFAGVDDEREWDPAVLELRRLLEQRFERDVRAAVAAAGLVEDAWSVEDVLGRFSGPSLSTFVATEGTRHQFAEFCIHRSAYQLKEADAHSFGLPRFSGARKAAFIEIQADEYGNGRIGEAHADLFGGVLRALGVDSTYGAHIDVLPAVTLATDNLVTLFGTHRRLRAALLGHLAGFEMTSVVPMERYAAAARRLGLGPRVQRFYDVHVEADEHHGALASGTLVGGDVEADGLARSEILFGVAAMLVLEDRFARRLLREWAEGRSSLRSSRDADPTG